MARPVAEKKLPIVPLAIGAVVVIVLIAGMLYVARPRPDRAGGESASAEAKAYVANLTLTDVGMNAKLNFMQQQVVEIEGKIANNGPRALRSVDVFCVFHGVNGQGIYRERIAIVRSKAQSLKPKETRPFRLAFDNLPDGWNQAMPTLVIAQITFAD